MGSGKQTPVSLFAQTSEPLPCSDSFLPRLVRYPHPWQRPNPWIQGILFANTALLNSSCPLGNSLEPLVLLLFSKVLLFKSSTPPGVEDRSQRGRTWKGVGWRWLFLLPEKNYSRVQIIMHKLLRTKLLLMRSFQSTRGVVHWRGSEALLEQTYANNDFAPFIKRFPGRS